VGSELVEALSRMNFPVRSLRLFASWNTAGEKIPFKDDEVKVEPISAEYFDGADLVFFAAHEMVSRDLAEQAAGAGVTVIDASRNFRMDPQVPLVVPEVNPDAIVGVREGRNIVASPSAQTVILSLAAAPIKSSHGLERIIATVIHGSTTQGRAGFEEHQHQTIDLFNQKELAIEKFVRQTAFNLFPRVGGFEGGHTEAERELMDELPRVIRGPVPLSVTAVQAPIFCGLAVSANFELHSEASAGQVRETLANSPGVSVIDEPSEEGYPDTMLAMSCQDILVGRVREDPSKPRSIQLWISADNLRRGAAVNMVKIAELLAGLDN